MAYVKNLETFESESGNLNVFEGLIPDKIERVYFINNVPKNILRGKHRHHKTWQALVCITGSCRIYVDNGNEENIYNLDNNQKCLIIEPKDWHFMDNFSSDANLLVIANQKYSKDDYIDEPYSNNYQSHITN
jgi:tellurite resistance-related uncharacterized protein